MNASVPFYVRVNSTAVDYGAVSENYLTGSPNFINIISVKDFNNTELLSSSLDANIKNTFDFINTSLT